MLMMILNVCHEAISHIVNYLGQVMLEVDA